MYTPTNAGAL